VGMSRVLPCLRKKSVVPVDVVAAATIAQIQNNRRFRENRQIKNLQKEEKILLKNKK